MPPRGMMTTGSGPVGGRSINGGMALDTGRRRHPPVPKDQAEMIRKQALAQAEALFKGKRARPEYQTDLKKLEASHGSKKFPELAKKFLEEYGLPEEWGALTRFLDYDDPTVGGGGAPGHGGPGGKAQPGGEAGFQGPPAGPGLNQPLSGGQAGGRRDSGNL